MASSPPTPASRPTCCSSPRASPPTPSGSTSTAIPQAYKAIPKPSRFASQEFEPTPTGGAASQTALPTASKVELAWKIDFKTLKQEAEAKAKPHWDKAESLNNDASALVNQIKDLRESIKGENDAETVRKKAEEEDRHVATSRSKPCASKPVSNRPSATAIYWPIYNLDIKNPNAPEDETHDPDKLLGEIQDTAGRDRRETQSEAQDRALRRI